MDPVTLAVGSAVLGSTLQATGSIMAGREGARAALFEQQQTRIQEQTERTAGAQAEARRLEELTANLGTIQAIRAGRGVGMSSPTGQTILAATTSEQVRDAQQDRLNHLLKADQSRLAAGMLGKKASYSLLSGYIGAGTALAEGGYKTGTLLKSYGPSTPQYQSLRV
jgi:hypothetical protein